MERDGADWIIAKRCKSDGACIICKNEFTIWHQGEEIKDEIGGIFVHANCVVSKNKFHHTPKIA